jgi:hypothetical protein
LEAVLLRKTPAMKDALSTCYYRSMAEIAPRAPRRIAGWKLAGLIGAVVALLVGTYAFYIRSVANRRWADMERSIQELRAQSDLRNGPRPVLRGTAIPGSAWEHYSPALVSMKGASSSGMGEYVTRGPKADRQKLDDALVKYAPALDGLRKGAMRADGHYPLKWEQGFSADIPGLLQSQNLGNLAVCRARLLAEEGKPREAAELLLDTCQFARDLGYNQILISEMIGIAIGGMALDELRDLILQGKLSKEELIDIARQLEILDGTFPVNGHSMLNEPLAAGFDFLKSGGDIDLSSMTAGGTVRWNYYVWRAVFPKRLICADFYFVELDYMKRFAAADARSWASCSATGSQAEMEIRKLGNPIAQLMVPGLSGSNRAGRERRTHLRFLRAMALTRATGVLPELDDPFGGKLLHSSQGGKVRIWSVGRDQVDNGGKGEWKANAGPDTVFEFDR